MVSDAALLGALPARPRGRATHGREHAPQEEESEHDDQLDEVPTQPAGVAEEAKDASDVPSEPTLAASAGADIEVGEPCLALLATHSEATGKLLDSQAELVTAMIGFVRSRLPQVELQTQLFGSRCSGLCNPDSDVGRLVSLYFVIVLERWQSVGRFGLRLSRTIHLFRSTWRLWW